MQEIWYFTTLEKYRVGFRFHLTKLRIKFFHFPKIYIFICVDMKSENSPIGISSGNDFMLNNRQKNVPTLKQNKKNYRTRTIMTRS